MPTADDVLTAAKRIGFTVPPQHVDEYREELDSIDEAVRKVLACPDYKPVVDRSRWPRTEIHMPTGHENRLRGWAYRANVGGTGADQALSDKRVVLKDTICLADVPLLFGTDAFEGYVPDVDATVVTRVLEHGGRILGKAMCENFSYGGQSSSTPYGPVENPYAVGFSAGGSSSGCAALVASNAADMAIGGDQGGSIRIPSAHCGLVGLKPTFGLVPYTGIMTFDPAVDSAGPMASTAFDAARLLYAIAGYDGIDDRQLGAPRPKNVEDYGATVLASRQGTPSLKGIRIGVLKEAFEEERLAPQYAASVEKAIKDLERLGATVTQVSVPFFNMARTIESVCVDFAAMPTREGMQVGRRGLYLNDYWDQLLPWTQDKFEKAKYFVTGCALNGAYAWSQHPTAYGRAMNLARKLRDDFDEVLEDLDAIVTPTGIEPARRHLSFNGGPAEWDSISCGVFTSAFNLTGHPALSVPVGLVSPMPVDNHNPEDSQIRLPVGMQLIGNFWSEGKLLSIADTWERGYDWKTRTET